MPTQPRDEHLASTFERLAAELRTGEATLYGYRVEHDPPPTTERGAVTWSEGWFEFDFEYESDAGNDRR